MSPQGIVCALLALLTVQLHAVHAEDPYLFFTWNVSYGTIAPLGAPQKVIMINGQFPGPRINCSSNNNIVINVFNNLNEPFLLSWFDLPADDYHVLIGDWYTKSHKDLAHLLDSGRSIARPAGVLINGKSGKNTAGKDDAPLFTIEAGKVYRYRISNVGIRTSLNFRIQGHSMKLVEMDGSHTVPNVYNSLDLHIGQCFSVLITADNRPMDYYMVASTHFMKDVQSATAVIRYAGSNNPPSKVLPKAPTG